MWIEKGIIFLRTRLLDTVQTGGAEKLFFVKAIERFQESYKTIKLANVNMRLAMEDLFLGF